MPAPSSRASRALSCFCRARLPRRAALGFLLDCTANPEYLRVPHPRPMRVGAYDRTPRSLFSVGCPRFDFLPGSWVPLPRESLRTARDCHPERSGPTFSSAPISGASGRALEGSLMRLSFLCEFCAPPSACRAPHTPRLRATLGFPLWHRHSCLCSWVPLLCESLRLCVIFSLS